MSAICGILDFSGAPIDPRALPAMVAAATHRGPDGVSDWGQPGAGLAHLAFHVTPESLRERQPLLSPDHRFVLVADARIDNRAELIHALRDEPACPPGPTDADLILAAFLRWGERCPEHLLGDFVLALWDSQARRLFLARDALGGRGLCYHYDGRRCLFASEVDQILAIPGWEARINERKVADYLADLTQGHEETYFDSIRFCPPGHGLSGLGGGHPPAPLLGRRSRGAYPLPGRPGLRGPLPRCPDRGDALPHALHRPRRALAERRPRLHPACRPGDPAAGRDPGTQRRLKTFSYVFDLLGNCDERAYIRPVVDRLGLDATAIPCDDQWALKDLARWPVERDTIWSDAYHWLVVAVAQAARDSGCRVLLNGQYGDVLFLGGYHWAAEMIREGRWRELARLWRAQGDYVEGWRDLIRNGLVPLLPHGVKQVLRRLRARPVWGNPGLHPALARRTRLKERGRGPEQERRPRGPGQSVRQAILTDNSWPQGFGDTRKFYARHGLQAESAYYDRRLVELVMALPADQLGRPWRGRWIQRNAMHGLLPEAVAERPFKTDFERLTRLGLFAREAPAVRSLLTDARCVEREFVRADWLRSTLALGGAVSQATMYYLWRIICLELWLRRLPGV